MGGSNMARVAGTALLLAMAGCGQAADTAAATDDSAAKASTLSVAAATAEPAPAPTQATPPDPTEYPPFTKAPPPSPPGPKSYPTRDGKLELPLGDASFADEVVSFRSGVPAPADKRFRDAGLALGPPDFIGDDDDERNGPKEMAMGCGGTLVLRFTDNVLIDVAGPDLYVFEVGPQTEATDIAISTDGQKWIEAGRVEGGIASLDIAKVAAPGVAYHYVRLIDGKSGCSSNFPGADIDAVAAIGAALSISLDSSVLFDVDQAVLKPAANDELIRAARVLKQWSGKTLAIEGHTDATGTPARNQALSEARAKAVRDFLAARPELKGKTLTATGFAATRPIASNVDPAGRARNRRVDLILAPNR